MIGLPAKLAGRGKTIGGDRTADDLMTDFRRRRTDWWPLDWRKAPFSTWGFRNVRRLIPTAGIAASGHAAGLETSLEEIGQIGFSGHDGKPTTVKQALRTTQTDAFVVLRRGRIAAEWYGNGMNATTPHIVFSVSKSICGTLGGILTDRGLLDPGDRVIDYVPELASSVYASCTIRHLLDMAVGIAFNEDYEDPQGDVVRIAMLRGGTRCRRARRRSICAPFSPCKSRTEGNTASVSLCLHQHRRARLGL